MSKLNDNSIMPFGKFKGHTLENVPGSYLWFIWESEKQNYEQKKLSGFKLDLMIYIEDNLDVIKSEIKIKR